MNDNEMDRMLRQALSSTVEPEEKLNESIMNRLKGRNRSKRSYRKRSSVAGLVAVFILITSITVVAAAQLLSSKQVVEQLGEPNLAQAFESSNAIEINQTIASGDYSLTLHGIVSGTGLREFNSSAHTIYPERTYAVVSIARQDGGPMPNTNDPEYGKEPFFVSPLIKGQKPWQVNIVTMNGGYSEVVRDGIMYRLIELDGVEMFADRGVYMAISSGSPFFNKDAFDYNEVTGEVSARKDYKEVSVLFELPLNKTKADPAKADAYLKELLKGPSADAAVKPAGPADEAEAELTKQMEMLKKKLPAGTVIPESVKEVAYDDKGLINYKYKDWSVKLSPELLFAEGQTGFSDTVHFSGDGNSYKALQFSRDKNGVITGRVIHLN